MPHVLRNSVRLISITSLLMIGWTSASACGGWLDVACNVGKAIEKGAQDTGKTLEKGAQDTGRTLEKAAQDTGKTLEKAAQDTGKALEKAAQDTGKTLEKAGQDAGKTLEKAAHDTGRTLEKAGQDVGHFLKQATNFSLSCKLEGKPADMQDAYKSSCSGALSTLRNDLDVCNSSGGASLLAAGSAGAILSTGPAAAATYALAKITFELCQKACRSQEALKSCILKVDATAKATAQTAATSEEDNRRAQAKLDLFQCVDSAYTAEKRLIMHSILAACEQDKSCNTKSDVFSKRFVDEVNLKHKEIDEKRDVARRNIRAGANASLEYGPLVKSDQLRAIAVSEVDSGMACNVQKGNITLTAEFIDATSRPLRILWLRDGKQVSSSYIHVSGGSKSLKTSLSVVGNGFGKWQVRIVGVDNLEYGSFGFLYGPAH